MSAHFVPTRSTTPSRVFANFGARSTRTGDCVSAAWRSPELNLFVTPDGTRSGSSHWKSGFYRIAREARLPVTLGYVDRTTMTTGLGPTIDPTGDVPRDMDVIRAFYADKSGVRPEHRVEPRLREELAAE